MTKPIQDLVAEYLAFWAESDIEGLKTLYADDVQYNDLTSGEIVSAKDLSDFLSKTFYLESESQFSWSDPVYPDDNSAFYHWTQTLCVAGRTKPVEVGGVELLMFRDGKIVSVHEFYDYRPNQNEKDTENGDTSPEAQMKKLGLDDQTVAEIQDKIERYFANTEAYLDPDISLPSMAEALHVTRNQASFVINHVMECGFYDLVNRYRIQYVMNVIAEGNTRFSVVSLAMEAGFNSISVFYTAFKKHAGMTPTAYAKHIKGMVSDS